MSEMPDFEMPAPMFEDPKPTKKPRKKPTKRRKAVLPPFPKPKRVAKKRKATKRRGRPAGVPNKPKAGLVVTDAAVQELTLMHHQDLGSAFLLFKKYTPAMRARLLAELKDFLL